MAGPTVKEIAKRAGVSTASVSVALNGKAGVSEMTRTKILEVAAEMGYSAVKSVEGENSGKPICFLIYVDRIVGIAQESTFYTFVLKGVETAAKEMGYRVMVQYCYANGPDAFPLQELIRECSGLLILGTDMTMVRRTELLDLIYQTMPTLPIVIVDNFIFSSYVDCVGNDNLYGAKAAVSYLVDHGHRKIGYLRAKQRITNFDDREMGVRMALAEHLEAPYDTPTVVDVDISAQKAYVDICDWLDHCETLPDALFAENDIVAAAAIRAFTTYGIRVPDDVSIIGFDDIPVCEMVSPTITTVRSFKEKLGVVAMNLLHHRITNRMDVHAAQESGVVKIAMSTKVVERSSVKTLSTAKD